MSNAETVLVCESCGRPDGVRIGDRIVCPECYEKAGSCCMEFGADDLWKVREQKSSEPED